jgi:sigma-E factor negative regulatory protein RseA
MNQPRHLHTSDQTVPTDDQGMDSLSAFSDSELTLDAAEALFSPGEPRSEILARWASYHLIGEVLRQERPVHGSCSASEFLAHFNERLGQERADEAVVVPVPGSVLAHAGMGSRGPLATNDAVFRWRLVAGLASLAAVAAVGWGLVGGYGTQAPAMGEMAQASPEAAGAEQTVVVHTAQGEVLRDARLQELLSDHRQFGAMSALQMPAGFLRNATYDVSPQR